MAVPTANAADGSSFDSHIAAPPRAKFKSAVNFSARGRKTATMRPFAAQTSASRQKPPAVSAA